MANDASTNDIMNFLQDHMVTREEFNDRFGGLENKVEKLEKKVDSLDQKVDTLDQKIDSLDQKVNRNKLEILDAMDEKLAHLKYDLTNMMRGGDKKLVELIKILADKQVLDSDETSKLLQLHPFPQT